MEKHTVEVDQDEDPKVREYRLFKQEEQRRAKSLSRRNGAEFQWNTAKARNTSDSRFKKLFT